MAESGRVFVAFASFSHWFFSKGDVKTWLFADLGARTFAGMNENVIGHV